MESWKSIILLSFAVYAVLEGVFYIVAGALYMKYYNDNATPLTPPISSAADPMAYMSGFTIFAGAMIIACQTINFLWLFNLALPTKWVLGFTNNLFDLIIFGLMMTVGVMASC